MGLGTWNKWPVRKVFPSSFILLYVGELIFRGDKQTSPSPLPVSDLEGVPVMDVACGHSFSLLYVFDNPCHFPLILLRLTVSGSVYSFGSASDGQLGLGSTEQKLTPHVPPSPLLSVLPLVQLIIVMVTR